MNRDLIYNYYNSKVDSSRSTYFHTSEKNNNNDSMKLECSCNRSPETIKCRHCGLTFIGRKRMCCMIHQDTIHLMDFLFCPGCKKVL